MTQHNSDACERGCTYVAHRDFIHVSPAQRAAAERTRERLREAMRGRLDLESLVIPLGRFTLPGWTGCLTWYVFQCGECSEMSVDYAHGHRLYLSCQNSECRMSWSLRGKGFYDDSDLPSPPTPEQEKKLREEIMRRVRALPPPNRN